MHPARYVVMGVAGSGKTLIGTRLARALGIAFVEGDDYHPPANVAKMAAGIPLTDADRLGWLTAIAARIAEACLYTHLTLPTT
jgi:gluconokinase